VTYNAASTNPRTREELLGQVVTQVKNLGGSPARMLFVANRIDEFRRDEDWKASERAFLEALTVDTRARVKHELPEHARAAEGLRILPLSSEAAMAAELLRSEDRAAQGTGPSSASTATMRA
jgi:hypothetical protein